MVSEQGDGDPKVGRSYHHGNLRAAAVEEAINALAHKMPSEISLRELAKAIGVGHSALYAHFRDRDELFAVVSEQGFEALRAEMQAALAKPGETISKLSRAYLRFARANPAHYRVMYGPNNLLSPVGSQIEEVCNACLQMLVAAIREAALVPEDEARRRAIGVWCVLHGLVSLADRAGPLRKEISDEAEVGMADAFTRVLAINA